MAQAWQQEELSTKTTMMHSRIAEPVWIETEPDKVGLYLLFKKPD